MIYTEKAESSKQIGGSDVSQVINEYYVRSTQHYNTMLCLHGYKINVYYFYISD